MKRYFRRAGDWEGIGKGAVWLEFDADYPTRQVELYDGRWYSSIDEYHPELGGGLSDRPLPWHEFQPDEEVSAEEFAAAWNEALRHRTQNQRGCELGSQTDV
jgi:hypothetical protein